MSIPPLLLLAEGRRPRPRRALAHAPKELALHMSIAKLLRDHIKSDWRWSHFPAGELRTPRTAAKLRAMGTMPGWPDLILISPDGLLHGLELKRVGGSLTEDQQAFQSWAIRQGVPHAVARSIDDALIIFESWGCLRIRVGGAA